MECRDCKNSAGAFVVDRQSFQAYLLTCWTTGKHYIGITSRGLRQRWNEHLYDARQRGQRMVISRAIRKYGGQQFTLTPLFTAFSWSGLCETEQVLIEMWNTRAPNGYNTSHGGEGSLGVKHTPEAIERSAAKHRGRPCHPNTRSASHVTHFGVPKTKSHREAIARAKTGIARSDETRVKIAAYWAIRRAKGDFKTDRPYAHHRPPP